MLSAIWWHVWRGINVLMYWLQTRLTLNANKTSAPLSRWIPTWSTTSSNNHFSFSLSHICCLYMKLIRFHLPIISDVNDEGTVKTRMWNMISSAVMPTMCLEQKSENVQSRNLTLLMPSHHIIVTIAKIIVFEIICYVDWYSAAKLFGTIWDVFFKSEIKLKLCLIFQNFQNGCHLSSQ